MLKIVTSYIFYIRIKTDKEFQNLFLEVEKKLSILDETI